MALRRYLESRNTPDAREKVLVDYAERIMQEELEDD